MDINDLYDQPDSLSLQDDNERQDLLTKIEQLEEDNKRARELLQEFLAWSNCIPSVWLSMMKPDVFIGIAQRASALINE